MNQMHPATKILMAGFTLRKLATSTRALTSVGDGLLSYFLS